MKFIYLTPVGEVNQNLLNCLQAPLQERFQHPCQMVSKVKVSQSAYNKWRDQYEADQVLLEMEKRELPQALKVLAITSVDLYSQGLNFVFGLARIGGRHCLISTARLNPRFWGEGFDGELFFERVLKEAVHELGHTFGLTHCRDPRCVMCFSNSLSDTDYKSSSFCTDCQQKFQSG